MGWQAGARIAANAALLTEGLQGSQQAQSHMNNNICRPCLNRHYPCCGSRNRVRALCMRLLLQMWKVDASEGNLLQDRYGFRTVPM